MGAEGVLPDSFSVPDNLQWKLLERQPPKISEAYGMRSGGAAKQSCSPQEGGGMHETIFSVISVARANAWLTPCAVFQSPIDLFSSFYSSVVPTVYTIYMGKDKYESKYAESKYADGWGNLPGVRPVGAQGNFERMSLHLLMWCA